MLTVEHLDQFLGLWLAQPTTLREALGSYLCPPWWVSNSNHSYKPSQERHNPNALVLDERAAIRDRVLKHVVDQLPGL